MTLNFTCENKILELLPFSMLNWCCRYTSVKTTVFYISMTVIDDRYLCVMIVDVTRSVLNAQTVMNHVHFRFITLVSGERQASIVSSMCIITVYDWFTRVTVDLLATYGLYQSEILVTWLFTSTVYCSLFCYNNHNIIYLYLIIDIWPSADHVLWSIVP